MAIRGQSLGDDRETGQGEQRHRSRAGQVVRMINLDHPLDAAGPAQQDIDVDNVDERATAAGHHLAQRRQRASDVEEVVYRLAQQHEVLAALIRSEVLNEPGDRLHTGGPRDRELVRGRIEDGCPCVQACRQYPGDHHR